MINKYNKTLERQTGILCWLRWSTPFLLAAPDRFAPKELSMAKARSWEPWITDLDKVAPSNSRHRKSVHYLAIPWPVINAWLQTRSPVPKGALILLSNYVFSCTGKPPQSTLLFDSRRNNPFFLTAIASPSMWFFTTYCSSQLYGFKGF